MPRKQCNAVLDLWKRKHPMGSAMYAAIYSAAHVNQTFLNDMWIWRYPSLPCRRQPRRHAAHESRCQPAKLRR